VTLSQRGTDSANESFVTAPEEPNYAEMAFHVEIDMTMTAAAHNANGDLCSNSEARLRPDWPKWQHTIEHEIETLERAGTWDTVPCPEGKNVVGSKWVFRLKRKADGAIDKYKARLVARGFTQIYGIDYFNTFSPVAKLASIRTILAIAACYDWDIDTFDFNSAYLNGELGEEEEIYMQEPPGFEESSGSMKRLRKSLYRLKQAGRRWYDTLTRALNDLGLCVT
jgi:Reverse transcriptase (RNA-dependent DNA polymerase)